MVAERAAHLTTAPAQNARSTGGNAAVSLSEGTAAIFIGGHFGRGAHVGGNLPGPKTEEAVAGKKQKAIGNNNSRRLGALRRKD